MTRGNVNGNGYTPPEEIQYTDEVTLLKVKVSSPVVLFSSSTCHATRQGNVGYEI